MSDLPDLGWNDTWQAAFDAARRESDEPARVVEEQREAFRVHTSHSELAATVAGRLRHLARSREALPAVGDWVAVRARPAEGRATIVRILPRRGALLRRAVDGTRLESAGGVQVVAANLDVVFCVTSLNQDFSPRRLERYLALVWDSGARPVLVLNKADLAPEPAAARARAEAVSCGAPVLVLSARTGVGMEALEAELAPGCTAALVGSSGVGKSTLLNRLAGETVQHVEEVRAADDKGRHTTTHRQLFRLPGGALVIDTPGLRQVAVGEGGDAVGEVFADLAEMATKCRFRDCRHRTEPGCALRDAVEDGSVDAGRLADYGKLLREGAHMARKADVQARLAERRRWKRITMEGRRRRRAQK